MVTQILPEVFIYLECSHPPEELHLAPVGQGTYRRVHAL